MKVLVTGGTGNVGGLVVKELLQRGAEVRILARKQPEKGKLPAHAEFAIGDMLDPVSLGTAMDGIDKLFLLSPVVPEELTQTLLTYGVARRRGVKHITYLSVFKVDQFPDVPHFASKTTVENALRQLGVPYTILRAAYYMQNDGTLQGALTEAGVYPMPIGAAGIAAVDVRDIAEAAAISLTTDGHEGQTYDLVGPSLITGPDNAALWTNLLGRQVQYGGHDFEQWETQMRSRMPAWSAFDLRTMFQGFYDHGWAATKSQIERITTVLGHSPRSYADFARETATQWKA